MLLFNVEELLHLHTYDESALNVSVAASVSSTSLQSSVFLLFVFSLKVLFAFGECVHELTFILASSLMLWVNSLLMIQV